MIIVLNNKSNLTYKEFIDYQKKLGALKTNNDIVLCPSTINIPIFNQENIFLGGQFVSIDKGLTGEITSKQLKSYNVKYCLVGHSETRENYNEDNLTINIKIKNLISENITPILCVGELEKVTDINEITKIITKQLLSAIENLSSYEKSKIIIAYEPAWVIATKNIPSIEQIDFILKKIKKILPQNTLLYGGGITENNINNLKKVELINGYLLGSLSLDILKLTKFLQELKK